MTADAGLEITELVEFDVSKVAGVGSPANGTPILLMKQVAPEPAVKSSHPPYTGKHSHAHPANGSQDGDEAHEHEHSHDGDADHGHGHAGKSALDIIVKAVTGGVIDQGPDVDLGHQIMGLIARAIEQEAQEIAAGSYGEVCDVDLLTCAAGMITRWLGHEQAPGDDMLMQSAAKGIGWGDWRPEDFAAFKAAYDAKDIWVYSADEVAKDSREFSADERKKHAAEGNALPDGSYPIPDKDALRRAAILARSGHGDVAAAKRLIARRARELGVANPLDDKDDDASKAQIAKGATDVDTGAQGDGLSKAVEDALAKAMAPLEESLEKQAGLLKGLGERLAKVEAAPIPGGPVLSRNVQVRQPGGVAREDLAAKAAYYREQAQIWDSQDRETADGYRKMARDADARAVTPPTT